MALRYNQFKQDGTAIGTIITWAGNTIPDGYLVCDGTTYTITGVTNQKLSNLASIISGQYDASDTYPSGNSSGTGTFTLPNMNVDDVVVGVSTQTLGSRAGTTNAAFGETKLNAAQWPTHRHSLPRQDYALTNAATVTTQPVHYGATVNAARCPADIWGNYPACMSYRVYVPGTPVWRNFSNPPRYVNYACNNRFFWRSPPTYGGCNQPGNTSYGPANAASGLAMGPETFFAYEMGSAGSTEDTVASHTHSANTIQPSMRMQFLIKAF